MGGFTLAATNTRWTATTLAAHLRGTVDSDADAGGGSVPDRIMALVVETGQRLWNHKDWVFRRKRGTLTTADGTETYDAPADFGELDQRVMHDSDETLTGLRFTENAEEFQRVADNYDSSDATQEGAPRIALVSRDWDEDAWAWHFVLCPVPDKVYVYPYWYVMTDPWQAGTMANDTTALVWPDTFNEGWRRLASAAVLEMYGHLDRANQAGRQFNTWLEKQIGESNETITTGGSEFITDGYNDLGNLRSSGDME